MNIGGTGILVPFENEPGQEDKVKKITDQSRIHIARNVLDAAEFIDKIIRLTQEDGNSPLSY